jgi:flagellar motor switch protein FliM
MSENVLSQEEIDALLSAMDRGEVDLSAADKAKAAAPEVRAYDLTSQNAMLRHQFYALEEVWDKFANLLARSLSGSLKRAVEVSFISTELVKYGEFIQAFSSPTSFGVFSMEPLIGSSLLAVEPGLVFSLIDCMFGGEGKPLEEMREFTQIEQRMMTKFAAEVLRILEKAWEIVYPVHVGLKKTETKPEYVHLVTPDELMITVVLSVAGGAFTGNIHFCLSYRMLEPIKDKLSSKYLREKEFEAAFSAQIQELLQTARVRVTGELGRSRQTIRDLINLKVDDVIRLSNGPQDPIVVNVERVPKFMGFPGVVKGNRAVQITGLIRS